MRANCFKLGIKRAFTNGLQGDRLPGRTSSSLDVPQEPLSLKTVGLDGDHLPSQVIGHAASAYGLNAPGFKGDGEGFIMGNGPEALGLAIAGSIRGKGWESEDHQSYDSQISHEVSIP